MSTLAGLLNVDDAEHAVVNAIGQELVFDSVKTLLAEHREELAAATSVFIEKDTEKFSATVLLPPSGGLQLVGNEAAPAEMKRGGSYAVAYPIRNWAIGSGGNRIDMAYMTVEVLQAHLTVVMDGDFDTMRNRIFTALFENTNLAWTDPRNGALTIRRLANTDGTIYPQVPGAAAGAEDDHYINAGYTVASIADAADPTATLRAEIAEHFGGPDSRGRNFVYFHGTDQTQYLKLITGYDQLSDQYVTEGNDTATIGRPSSEIPGDMYGRLNGVWLSEYAWIPAKYGIMILMDVPAPLYKRNDPAVTGLPKGLALVGDFEQYPLESTYWQHRYGLGVANRLSAACIEINDAGGSYDPPTDFAE